MHDSKYVNKLSIGYKRNTTIYILFNMDSINKYALIVITQLLSHYLWLSSCKTEYDKMKIKRSTELEVRSVFLNCQLEDTNEIISTDNELTRFQREEFFKHNTLHNCKKKLAVTVKMCNEPDKSSTDEFIPIEHILSAHNKRIRLLNPYILRLRRESPFQVYKIRKLDTVKGVFSNKHFKKESEQHRVIKRDSGYFKTYYADNNSDNDTNILKMDPSHYEDNYSFTAQNGEEISDDFFGNTERKLNSLNKRLLAPRKSFVVSKLANSNQELSADNFSIRTLLKNSKDNTPTIDKYYVLYEIGNPDIWYKAQVQLYEKVTTVEGKAMWNDLTKLKPARVSTIDPIWKNQDLSIRYRTKDFVKREEFSLPSGSLCLVLPLEYAKDNISQDDSNINNNGEFIIVPIDDVIVVKSNKEYTRRSENNVSNESSINPNAQRKRHVIIRTTRISMGGSMADLDIVDHGSERYLKLPYKSAHRTQLDLEAKADENKLIIIGSSGRLTSIVSDTRDARSTLNLQVTNTGLAPAHFRVVARECNPRLSEIYEYESPGDTVNKKSLIAPMHTKDFILEIPLEISIEDYLCSISLMNGDGESVATREVRIKRSDRCFCIWHCECVCLSEDPKLICRNMAEAELAAAGLSTREGPRRSRSACYPDIVTINMFVVFVGVLAVLFFFGIIKAFLGLIMPCVGSWRLELLLKLPRKLDYYYESSLKCRPVVYDKDGWPVHPDTKKRTVRVVSKPMEFVLNVIMFITLPCILVWDVLNQITNKCQCVDEKFGSKLKINTTNKCFSTHDMQSKEPQWRRRKGGMRKWMTPQAEELSTDIWQYGLSPPDTVACDCMQPLLNEIPCRRRVNDVREQPHIDSEQDDTEYVLMQMQKSKESLALKSS